MLNESNPQRLKLQDLDFAAALMFAITHLGISVVVADYSVIRFTYRTEPELARALKTWTNGDHTKLHIPGSKILESYPETRS